MLLEFIFKKFKRKKLKSIKREDMIQIKTREGLVSLPAPGQKQILVINPDGTAEIRTVIKKRIKKSNFGLKK